MPVESSLYRRYWRGLTNAFDSKGVGFGFSKHEGTLLRLRIDHVLSAPKWFRVRGAWLGHCCERVISRGKLFGEERVRDNRKYRYDAGSGGGRLRCTIRSGASGCPHTFLPTQLPVGNHTFAAVTGFP